MLTMDSDFSQARYGMEISFWAMVLGYEWGISKIYEVAFG